MSALLLLFLSVWSMAFGEPMPIDFDDFEMPSEAGAASDEAQKRRAAIAFLDASLEEASEGVRRVELLLRLAHLHHKEGRASRDVAMLGRAVRYYAKIQAEHPRHDRPDHVAFYLAFARVGAQLDREADGLQEMIRAFPASAYVPHARLHRAEQLFRLERYEAAAHHYAVAAGSETFPFEIFARYKGIWSLYRLGRKGQALADARALVHDGRLGVLRPLVVEMVAYWSDEQGEPLAGAGYSVQVMREPDLGCEGTIPALRARQHSHGDLEAQVLIVRCYLARSQYGLARAEWIKAVHQYGPGTRWFGRQSADNRRRARRSLRVLARDVGRR